MAAIQPAEGRPDHRSGAGVFNLDASDAATTGRHGVFSGQAIIRADGTRLSLTPPHPSGIIGNKSSVIAGQGVVSAP